MFLMNWAQDFLRKSIKKHWRLNSKKKGSLIVVRLTSRYPIKGHEIKQDYIADFICYDKIIVELKAVEKLNEVHLAQVFNYLKATGFDLAILANFGEKMLKMERLFNFMKK